MNSVLYDGPRTYEVSELAARYDDGWWIVTGIVKGPSRLLPNGKPMSPNGIVVHAECKGEDTYADEPGVERATRLLVERFRLLYEDESEWRLSPPAHDGGLATRRN